MGKIEDRQELQEELTKINGLLESPGYAWLREICEIQFTNRMGQIILVSPEGADDMVKKTYALGECAAIKLVLSLPELHKEQIELDLKRISKELDNE